MIRQLFECPCPFHCRSCPDDDRETLTLPAPILLRPQQAEHSFVLWLIRTTPRMSVAAVVSDAAKRPYPREFTSMFQAAKFVCRFYYLPVPDEELKRLCGGEAIAKEGVLLSEIVHFKEPRGLMPLDYGQSAICYGWKTTSNFLMPPSGKSKRPKLVPPPRSPEKPKQTHTYNIEELGGKEDEVQRLIADHPIWNSEVLEMLLFWGARPKLVEINHITKDREFTLVNCTFAQPNGTWVKNVILPLGLLRMEYPSHVQHIE